MLKKTIKTFIVGYFIALVLLFVPLILLISNNKIIVSSTSSAHPNILSFTFFLLVIAVMLLMLFVIIGIGAYVYQDAKQRGMTPLLWALIAALGPYFIGLIVYLIVRQPLKTTCSECGTIVENDLQYCPHCGNPLKKLCSSCTRTVPNDALFCPHCGNALQSENK